MKCLKVFTVILFVCSAMIVFTYRPQVEAQKKAGEPGNEISLNLPRPDPVFHGKIGETFKDSTSDTGLFTPPTAPKDAPNILLVLIDDAGFGASSTFGGPCNTPTLQKLVDNGLCPLREGQQARLPLQLLLLRSLHRHIDSQRADRQSPTQDGLQVRQRRSSEGRSTKPPTSSPERLTT